MVRDPASFRDPSGSVYVKDDKVYRTVSLQGVANFRYVRDTPLIQSLVADGKLVPEKEVAKEVLGDFAQDSCHVLEHPPLPFISYPYEWCFYALKDAALLQLDICIEALGFDVILSDASAYNVQFDGVKPIFIDHLSFVRYHDGQVWGAHSQFCEQFLNPLLLESMLGVAPQAWYRGNLEGIPIAALNRLLPWHKKLSPTVLMHVALQDRFNRRSDRNAESLRDVQIPKTKLINMLCGLRAFIEDLTPRRRKTLWQDYPEETSYSESQTNKKRQFIERYVNHTKPRMLIDIGCNTGEYSRLSLTAGAERAIGLEPDLGALDKAYNISKAQGLRMTPLFGDIGNPSPNQGWMMRERRGIRQRLQVDGVLSLALLHHLSIGKNIPLAQALDYLTDLAPSGVIEFVPKSDPMVQELLALRADIFHDYTEEAFVHALTQRCSIVESQTTTDSGRTLYWYQRVTEPSYST